MKEERLRILKMVEEGKISTEEASELLETLEPMADEKEGQGKIKKIKILVEEHGEKKVNISLPFALAKTALRFIPKKALNSMEEEDIDFKELLNTLESDLEKDSPLVNIHDGDTRVVITVE